MANCLVHQASIEPNLHLLYMEYLDGTGDFRLVFQKTYKRIGFALTTELLFEHSFEKNVLKNLTIGLAYRPLQGVFLYLASMAHSYSCLHHQASAFADTC